jgi:hypothetical protein
MEMGNKPSRVRQREVELMIRGARNEGCKQIEIRWGTDASVIIPLEDDQKPIATEMEPPAAA